jgi:hypothetical protein
MRRVRDAGKDIVISLAKTIRPAADNFQNPIETWVTRCFEDEAPFDMVWHGIQLDRRGSRRGS